MDERGLQLRRPRGSRSRLSPTSSERVWPFVAGPVHGTAPKVQMRKGEKLSMPVMLKLYRYSPSRFHLRFVLNPCKVFDALGAFSICELSFTFRYLFFLAPPKASVCQYDNAASCAVAGMAMNGPRTVPSSRVILYICRPAQFHVVLPVVPDPTHSAR